MATVLEQIGYSERVFSSYEKSPGLQN